MIWRSRITAEDEEVASARNIRKLIVFSEDVCRITNVLLRPFGVLLTLLW